MIRGDEARANSAACRSYDGSSLPSSSSPAVGERPDACCKRFTRAGRFGDVVAERSGLLYGRRQRNFVAHVARHAVATRVPA
jgi:hypothetical protein